MKNYFFTILLSCLLLNCQSKQDHLKQQMLQSLESTVMIPETPVSLGVISAILENIPSPLEMSVLLKNTGAQYEKQMLSCYQNPFKYNTNYKKALNLGIYATDLGFSNIFEQNQEGINYFNAIKVIADNLQIGQFFDFRTINRLAIQSQNLDSLLLISTKSFNQINHYFQDQNRANLSILMLTGGWLEALHIACQIVINNPENRKLKEKIGEQKIILENISLLLSFYRENDPMMEMLAYDIAILKEVFDQIDIVHIYQQSTFTEKDGLLIIEDNSTSKVFISEKSLREIALMTQKIRNKITS
jgi:hypothetical protein